MHPPYADRQFRQPSDLGPPPRARHIVILSIPAINRAADDALNVMPVRFSVGIKYLY